MTEPLVVTEEFKTFIYDILRFRCLITEKTYKKIFDTEDSWSTIRQAFVHKSLGIANYELLEFEGDVELNLAVVGWIRQKFPDIISVEWNTRIKHNLISKKTLAQVAVRSGFTEHIAYSEQLAERISRFANPMDCRDYMDMNEDTVEALCGAISQILNKNTVRGVGHAACYNLIKSFLDAADVSIKYEDVFDAKSRMKALFDNQGWNRIKGCSLSNCLKVYTLSDEEIKGQNMTQREQALLAYKRSLNKNETPRKHILETEDRFLVLGYACIYNDPKNKVFLSVHTANNKSEAEQKVAEDVLSHLKRKGIWLTPSDPYKRS